MEGEASTVRPADVDALAGEFRRLAGDEDAVEVEDDTVVVTVGSATLAVTGDGTVTASMPLHEFHATGVEEVVVDHDRGAVGIATGDGDVCYEFRRPG